MTQMSTESAAESGLSALLAKVMSGEEFEFVVNGKVVAKLVAVPPEAESTWQRKNYPGDFSDHPAVGMWEDRDDMKDPGKWLRNARETGWGPARFEQ